MDMARQCEIWHKELQPEFISNIKENIYIRLDAVEHIVNLGLPDHFDDFKIDKDQRNEIMEKIEPEIDEKTKVQLNACSKPLANIKDYRTVARNRLNRNKPKFLGNFVFGEIIFLKLYPFILQQCQIQNVLDKTASMKLFINILISIFESPVTFTQTKPQPIVTYKTLVNENLFKSGCINLLKLYNIPPSVYTPQPPPKQSSQSSQANKPKIVHKDKAKQAYFQIVKAIQLINDDTILSTRNVPQCIISSHDICTNNRTSRIAITPPSTPPNDLINKGSFFAPNTDTNNNHHQLDNNQLHQTLNNVAVRPQSNRYRNRPQIMTPNQPQSQHQYAMDNQPQLQHQQQQQPQVQQLQQLQQIQSVQHTSDLSLYNQVPSNHTNSSGSTPSSGDESSVPTLGIPRFSNGPHTNSYPSLHDGLSGASRTSAGSSMDHNDCLAASGQISVYPDDLPQNAGFNNNGNGTFNGTQFMNDNNTYQPEQFGDFMSNIRDFQPNVNEKQYGTPSISTNTNHLTNNFNQVHNQMTNNYQHQLHNGLNMVLSTSATKTGTHSNHITTDNQTQMASLAPLHPISSTSPSVTSSSACSQSQVAHTQHTGNYQNNIQQRRVNNNNNNNNNINNQQYGGNNMMNRPQISHNGSNYNRSLNAPVMQRQTNIMSNNISNISNNSRGYYHQNGGNYPLPSTDRSYRNQHGGFTYDYNDNYSCNFQSNYRQNTVPPSGYGATRGQTNSVCSVRHSPFRHQMNPMFNNNYYRNVNNMNNMNNMNNANMMNMSTFNGNIGTPSISDVSSINNLNMLNNINTMNNINDVNNINNMNHLNSMNSINTNNNNNNVSTNNAFFLRNEPVNYPSNLLYA